MRSELIGNALCAHHFWMNRRVLRRIHNARGERNLIFRLRDDDTSDVDRLIAGDFLALKRCHHFLFADNTSAIRLHCAKRDLSVAVFGSSDLIADEFESIPVGPMNPAV